MTRILSASSLAVLLLLSACGGGGSTATSVSDIQGTSLNYGVKAQFDFYGSYLDNKGISASVPNCANQTPVFVSPVHQALTCTITTVGDINVQILDGAGAPIFSKVFTIPAPQVALVTSLGNIVVELDHKAAPLSVNNFLNYVQSGFYSNTLFHRVIAGFVVQGGGYSSGLVAKTVTAAPITLESNNGLSNLRGSLAMARTADPNSATSQFYFNLVDNLSLDYQDANNPGYAVFGKIVQGLDVMDAIGAVATATVGTIPDVPVTEVLVKSAIRIK